MGEVEGFSKVVPPPCPVVEDIRQANPEAKVSVAIPTAISDLVHDGFLLLPGIDLDQKATALLALSSCVVPGGIPLLEEVAAGVK